MFFHMERGTGGSDGETNTMFKRNLDRDLLERQVNGIGVETSVGILV